MSSAPSQAPSPADRYRRTGDRRARPAAARARTRRGRRGTAPEALEPRTLLATLPPVQLDPQRLPAPNGLDNTRVISGATINSYESQPTVVVNPADPQKLVAVWNVYNADFGPTPNQVRGAFSADGGLTWTAFNVMPFGTLSIFPVDNPVPFAAVTDITASFDRNGFLYIAQSHHSTDLGNGAIVVASYNFNGATPTLVDADVPHVWNQSDQNFSPKSIRKPQIVADGTLPSFTDPTTGQTLTNPGAGNVYLAWGTDVPPPQDPPNPWNRNTVELLVAPRAGGGGVNPLSFGAPITVGSGHAFTTAHDGSPRVAISQGRLPGTFGVGDAGVAPGQVSVVYDDFGSGDTAGPPVDFIFVRRFAPQANGTVTALGGPSQVAFTTVLGDVNSPYPLVTASNPRGIGPAPAIASDNTLGSTSATSGRLYVAYVDRYVVPYHGDFASSNPTDNTDVFLAWSDNGGLSWQTSTWPGLPPLKRPANDDSGFLDGFSEGVNEPGLMPGAAFGRPQFQPQVAVDPQTGTVVLSYLDTRYDAARARTAVSVATSIDGSIPLGQGPTFGPSTFVNAPQRAFDVASRRDVTLGPIPDNAAAQAYAGIADAGGFGDYQGLAVFNGKLYAAWSSNVNGGVDGNNLDRFLDIRLAVADFAAGPRVVASTMGQVQARSVVDLNTGATLSYNNRTTAQGVPIADGFVVTFDRPVDPATFTTADVRVFYHSPATPGSATGIPVPVLSVTPLNNGLQTAAYQQRFGATQFLVRFADQSAVGTYTYAIGPDIRDKIASPFGVEVYAAPRSQANLPAIPPVGTGGSGNPSSDVARSQLTISGVPASRPIFDVNVRVSLQHARLSDLTLRLVPPPGLGLNPIVLAAAGSLAGIDMLDVTFDDEAVAAIAAGAAPYTGVFRPSQPLSVLDGRALNGTWTLEVEDTVAGAGSVGRLLSWALVVTTRTTDGTAAQGGNLMDQDADGLGGEDPAGTLIIGTSPGDVYAAPRPNPDTPVRFFTDPATDVPLVPGPYDGATLPLIIPGPKVARSYVLVDHDRNPATPPVPTTTADDRVVDEAVSAVYVVFDRDMDPATFDASDVVSATGPLARRLNPATGQTVLTTQIFGPFVVTPAPNADPANPDPNPSAPRTYRISFPAETLSGTYVFNFGPEVRSSVAAGHDALDTNQNAGLAVLRGDAAGPEELRSVTYTQPAAVPIGGGQAGAIYTSTLVVPDNFQIKDVNVLLNIQYPRVADLEARLIGPNGTPNVLLFSNLRDTAPFANFTNTTFDDSATTPIQNGGPPFNGRFNPQLPLSAFIDTLSAGTWQLQVKVNAAGTTGQVLNWGLQLTRPVPSDGLGEPVADRAVAAFRIFTQDPTIAQSSQTWTAVGPAGVGAKQPGGNAEVAGRVNAVALDPSDPSGNTAYVASASGGIWKTTNFLTTDPAGPTYVPLTDNGPRFGMSINSIAVFGRNNDPAQSIILAATGDAEALGDPLRAPQTSRGLGFLRSTDGGRTWELLDSTDNTLPFAQRDHFFASAPGQAGVSLYKVVVDPTPTPNGEATFYAAVVDIDAAGRDLFGTTGASPKGGLWRSLDSGRTWQRMRAGQVTDVVLDPASADVSTGNLRFLYAAFVADGVYFSPNRGQSFNLMAGTTGNPLIQNADSPQPQPTPVNQVDTPNGKSGRVVLAKPNLTGDPLQDLLYQGWLYAAVVNDAGGGDGSSNPGGGSLVGVYLTKDFGQTWTRLHLPAIFTAGPPFLSLPSNDPTRPDIDPTGRATPTGTTYRFGAFDISLAVDPNNPNVIYLGGNSQFHDTGLIRIDTTGVHDSKAFYHDNRNPDGGLRRAFVTADPVTGGGVTDTNPTLGFGNPFFLDPGRDPHINLIRDPSNPFVAGATILVTDTGTFANSGAQVRWTQLDRALKPDVYANPFPLASDPWGRPAEGVHQILTVRDPLTGRNRMIFSTNQGVYTAVDNGDGTLVGSVGGAQTLDTPAGDVRVVQGSRNGNLQVAQMYSGAAQPSFLSAQLAALRGFLYGTAEDIGQPMSDPQILQVGTPGYGNLSWQGGFVPVPDRNSSRGAVAVQQELQVSANNIQGGTVYQWRPSEALVEVANADQPLNNRWPGDDARPSTDTFQVDAVGRTFGLYQVSQGGDVVDPQWPYRRGFNFAVNPLSGDQILISSAAGRVFKTDDRGLVWAEVGSPGALDGTYAQALAYGAPDPNDPTGGRILDNFLYAGTVGGNIFVTFTGGGGNGNNWLPLSQGLDGSPVQAIVTNPTRGTYEAYAVTQLGVYYNPDSKAGAAWQPITGNLFAIAHSPLADGFGDDGSENLLQALSTLQADWRYVIPDDFSNPGGPTHPVLYVAGRGGVYRSFDKGRTWSRFPEDASTNLLDSPVPGGGLPNVAVTDLDLSIGNVDPTTGRPNTAGGANVLVATTFGRGQFAIRLAPIVLPNQPGQPPILKLASTVESDTGLSQTDGITRNRTPFIVGYSEQTAFGNDVTVRLIDRTPGSPTFGEVVGVAKTDEFGRFVTVDPDGTRHAGIRIQKVVDDVPVFDAQGNPVPADLMTFDGKKTLGVQATNASGTKGNVAIVGDGTLTTLELDTTPPAAALRPDLQAGSDTGPNNADEITNPNLVAVPDAGTLRFDVTFDADEINTQATLYRNNVAVGVPVLGTGSAVLVDPGPISPDGTYAYKVVLVDQAGNASPDSPVLNVRVDTVAPAKPSRPTLDPNNPAGGSDSGAVGDNVTNVRQPFFIGTAEPNTLPNPNPPATIQRNRVTLVDQVGNVVGTGFVEANGQYSVQPTAVLGDGSYTFRVRVTDLAGNVGPDSDPITITIQSATPATPTLRMVLTDDSGVPGDNITNVRQPRFTGTGQPGLTVQVVDVLGNIPGSGGPGGIVPFNLGDPPVIVANDGTFTFRFPRALDDGTYRIAARTRDVAGNFADSAPLQFQILTAGPPAAGTLSLLAADDTGTKGDNTTSLRQIRVLGTGVAPGTRVALFVAGAIPDPSRELDRVTADAQGNYVLRPPVQLLNGVLSVVARTVDAAGNYGAASNVLNVRIATTAGDYNADGKADLITYNRGSGVFALGITGGGNLAGQFGPLVGSRAIPIQADFDGDGRNDYGYVDFATLTWYVARSQLGTQVVQFGQPGLDLPVPADYDGDGRADIAVFRPTTATWYALLSGGGVMVQQFGQGNRDRPLPADYDGDGKADLLIFRPDTAEWIGRLSGGSVLRQQFGQAGLDIPAPADYDGDGKADLAVFRPTAVGAGGQTRFYIKPVADLNSGRVVDLGLPGDVPVPQDYDGDGKADPTVFRPGAAQWLIRQSSNDALATRSLPGSTGSIPLGAPLHPYRMPGGPVGAPGGPAGGASAFGAASGGATGGAATNGLVAPGTTPGAGAAGDGSGGGGTVGIASFGAGAGAAAPGGATAGGTTGGATSGSTAGTAAADRLARRRELLRLLAERRVQLRNARLATSRGVPDASLALLLGRLRRG